MNSILVLFQKIGSYKSYLWFKHISKKVRPPYHHIIPNLYNEIRKYDRICNIYKQKKIEPTKYYEWREGILELLRKVDDKTELINYSHYLRLLERNYEATVSIPSDLFGFVLGVVLGAFFQWEDLTKYEHSIFIFGGIIAVICFIMVISIVFSITKRRPCDFLNDVNEIIEQRIEELNEVDTCITDKQEGVN